MNLEAIEAIEASPMSVPSSFNFIAMMLSEQVW